MKQISTQLRFTDKFTIEFQKTSIDCGEKQFLVRNSFSLISPGTELALYTGTHVGFSDPEITWAKYPIQPGYASVGVIIEGYNHRRGKIGDTVLHFTPHSSYSLIDPEKDVFFVLDQNLDKKAALFARFAQISATAIHVCHIQPASVLVFGAGLIGNLCAQLFQLEGVDVVLVDISEKRLELARQCGIKKIVNSGISDFRQQLHKITDNRGVDLIVEATGVPELVTQSLEIVNDYGEVLLLGSTRGHVDINVYKLIHRKKTILAGAHESYFPLRSKTGLNHETIINTILKHLTKAELKIIPLISHEIAPHEAKHAYEGLLKEKETYLGVLLNWKEDN